MKNATPAAPKDPVPAQEAEALGPRLQIILQQSIQPWKRETMGEEEAQLADLRRRPVRNRYDAIEAKRRLGMKPAKKGKGSRTKHVAT
jgi:hypothetical protein